MTAPRSTSLRALRLLSQQHPTPIVRRSLHITGAHSAPPSKVSDRGSLYSSHSLADLKNECQKRSLRAGGSKSELIERLSNHDVLQSRAFSIAMRRINSNAFAEQSNTRTFNTSRSSKTVNDASPVDFVYMPSMHEIESPHAFAPRGPRIPVLPEIPSSFAAANNRIPASASTPNRARAGVDVHVDADADTAAAATSAPLMKPQVYTVSGGAGSEVSASPMSEVVDNHAVEIDPFSLTETVGRSRFGEELERARNGGKRREERGVVGELWNGFLDDLLGRSQSQSQGMGQRKGQTGRGL